MEYYILEVSYLPQDREDHEIREDLKLFDNKQRLSKYIAKRLDEMNNCYSSFKELDPFIGRDERVYEVFTVSNEDGIQYEDRELIQFKVTEIEVTDSV